VRAPLPPPADRTLAVASARAALFGANALLFVLRSYFLRKRLVCTKHLSCRPGCARSGAAALAIAGSRARELGGLLPPTRTAAIRVSAALPVWLKGVRMHAQLQRNTATQQNQAAVVTNESGVLAKRKIKEIVDQVSASLPGQMRKM
jgi:hypothetical protein